RHCANADSALSAPSVGQWHGLRQRSERASQAVVNASAGRYGMSNSGGIPTKKEMASWPPFNKLGALRPGGEGATMDDNWKVANGMVPESTPQWAKWALATYLTNPQMGNATDYGRWNWAVGPGVAGSANPPG